MKVLRIQNFQEHWLYILKALKIFFNMSYLLKTRYTMMVSYVLGHYLNFFIVCIVKSIDFEICE